MNQGHQDRLETADPGWEPASLPFLALKDTFVSGDPSGKRLSIHYYRGEKDKRLQGKVLFGPLAQGPPGHAHGGGMAAILDEAMGGAAWMAGHPVVAAQLNISFQAMLPLGERCLVTARVDSVDGRKVHTSAALTSPDEKTVYCRGTGLFISLDRSHLEKMPAAAAEIVRKAGILDR